MADYQITYNGIAVGPDGRISIDEIDAFREASAEGDVYDVYDIAATYGSNYSVIGTGYHGQPQSLSGMVSDAWATVASKGAFSPGNAVYNSVKVDLAQAYAAFVSEHHRMPITDDVFQMHEDVFARNGIPGAWMGSTFPGLVMLGIGIEPWDPLNTDPLPEVDAMGNPIGHCFPASTPITISPTETRPISDIRVGDTVLAFDPSADLGRGALVPRKVVRLYRNTTEEWVKLTWAEGGEQKELVATPGHHFLDRFGNFPTIEEMLENGRATVILVSGELTEVTAERITYSAETAHLFEQAQAVGMIAGNTALMRGKTASVRVWA